MYCILQNVLASNLDFMRVPKYTDVSTILLIWQLNKIILHFYCTIRQPEYTGIVIYGDEYEVLMKHRITLCRRLNIDIKVIIMSFETNFCLVVIYLFKKQDILRP